MKIKNIKEGFTKAKDTLNNTFVEALVDVQTGNLPTLSKSDKILYSLAGATGIIAYGASPAFAGSDPFSTAENLLKTFYGKLLTISTALAVFLSVVALIMAMVSMDEQESKRGTRWLKKIWICWVLINGLGAFVSIGQMLTKDIGYNA